MSLYVASLTIPPNTPAAVPVSTVIYVGDKLIDSISIRFPNGCYNAVYTRIWDVGGGLIAPRNTGWISGNNQVLAWGENFALSDVLQIRFEGYSEAEDYSHTLKFYLTLNPVYQRRP